MTRPGESAPRDNVQFAMAELVARHRPYETIPPSILDDVLWSVEDTLSYGNDHILDAAQRMDEANFPVLAEDEEGSAMGQGKLLQVYMQSLQMPLEIFWLNPRGAEEYARLVVQHTYAKRWFAVVHANKIGASPEDIAKLQSSEAYVQAASLVTNLVTECRTAPSFIPKCFHSVI